MYPPISKRLVHYWLEAWYSVTATAQPCVELQVDGDKFDNLRTARFGRAHHAEETHGWRLVAEGIGDGRMVKPGP
jgi:hypothetical protein